ncbi:MAG: SDR family oxidoreductase, partial [Gammaproteobacteria bacterium]|nr:SDR family oxidoreductase [Gammaproteobacteria bacterium]
MTTRLDGRAALVTGGAAGLGRVISHSLADAGATGLVLDTAEHCADLPPGWFLQQGDVASEQDVAAAVADIDRRFGRLDIVIANAGLVPPWHETGDIDLEEWDRVFAVNVRGVAATIKHSVPLLRRDGGSIVVMASLNSRRGHPQQCLYTASKHAVLGIVRSVALDLGRFGIRVNALGPGPIATHALTERIRHRAGQGGPPLDEALASYAADTALGAT